LHVHTNGTIYVTDDTQKNTTKGAGFKDSEDAIKWFKRIDDSRTQLS
jgi:hypothetical protein